MAVTLNELGNLAFNADRYDEAEANFRQALDIWSQVYGPQHRFVGLSYANLASIYSDAEPETMEGYRYFAGHESDLSS